MEARFMSAFEIGYADFLKGILFMQLEDIEKILKQGLNNNLFEQRFREICDEAATEVPSDEEIQALIRFSNKIFKRKISEAMEEIKQYCKLVVRANEET